MGLFKKQKSQQKSRSSSRLNELRPPAPPPTGDPKLPGTAGYRGTDPLPKNCMPESRFRYVRPDGKPD